MPHIDPHQFAWLEQDTTYSDAACLTLVAGLNGPDALQAIGADVERPTAGRGDPAVPGDYPTISAVATETKGAPGTILIEDNGDFGAQPQALAELSKRGRAASVFWNVEGLVVFACARRGKWVCDSELPDVPNELPRGLAGLIELAARDEAPLVAVATAMAVTYTGVPVEARPELLTPYLWYPITRPTLRLPVTTDELIRLGLPSVSLVAAVMAADEGSRRRMAEWSVSEAFDRVGLLGDPAVQDLLVQFGRGRPTAMSLDLARHCAEAERETEAVGRRNQRVLNDRTLPAEEHRQALENGTKWAHLMWALRASTYTTLDDSVTASLGAAYCASYSGVNRERFLAQIAAVLTASA